MSLKPPEYFELHKWVYKVKGRPSKCEHCGTSTARKYEWSNISRQYLRDIKDWQRLCIPCHRQYDKLKVCRASLHAMVDSNIYRGPKGDRVMCKECISLRGIAYRRKNRDKISQNYKKWYWENHEEQLSRFRAYNKIRSTIFRSEA